jgi:hypothetical protein
MTGIQAILEFAPLDLAWPVTSSTRSEALPDLPSVATSSTTLGGALFKKEADLKPHRFRYWLTPKPDPAFDAKCADICEVYQAAAGADSTPVLLSESSLAQTTFVPSRKVSAKTVSEFIACQCAEQRWSASRRGCR